MGLLPPRGIAPSGFRPLQKILTAASWGKEPLPPLAFSVRRKCCCRLVESHWVLEPPHQIYCFWWLKSFDGHS
ncbi:hypothetical protein PVK06_034714 [Gossypium arboreum]|uniref:Uncharacterized protein n=1 Tax=Gossypium arboreum TaxID=29729 RepID=A0ABR0NI00_GOSAR|nr:hypothetical protein PVK06_034714 [Gossypium arboreum]